MAVLQHVALLAAANRPMHIGNQFGMANFSIEIMSLQSVTAQQ